VANYFAYGEWEVPKYEMDFKLIEKNPDARLNIFKCPWHAVWKENNLLQYGANTMRVICLKQLEKSSSMNWGLQQM
ncbi:MAG: hypothetical protein QNK30_06820, partial [Bacteroidales bacterium]|nr:hypothetical protein [Bacteroidales bacterium]